MIHSRGVDNGNLYDYDLQISFTVIVNKVIANDDGSECTAEIHCYRPPHLENEAHFLLALSIMSCGLILPRYLALFVLTTKQVCCTFLSQTRTCINSSLLPSLLHYIGVFFLLTSEKMLLITEIFETLQSAIMARAALGPVIVAFKTWAKALCISSGLQITAVAVA